MNVFIINMFSAVERLIMLLSYSLLKLQHSNSKSNLCTLLLKDNLFLRAKSPLRIERVSQSVFHSVHKKVTGCIKKDPGVTGPGN